MQNVSGELVKLQKTLICIYKLAGRYRKVTEELWAGRFSCVNAVGRGDVSGSRGLALCFHAASRSLKRMWGARVLVRASRPWKRLSARFLADPSLIVTASQLLQVTRNGRSPQMTPGSVGARSWEGGTLQSFVRDPSALQDGAASLSPCSPLIWDLPSSKAGCSNEPSN